MSKNKLFFGEKPTGNVLFDLPYEACNDPNGMIWGKELRFQEGVNISPKDQKALYDKIMKDNWGFDKSFVHKLSDGKKVLIKTSSFDSNPHPDGKDTLFKRFPKVTGYPHEADISKYMGAVKKAKPSQPATLSTETEKVVEKPLPKLKRINLLNYPKPESKFSKFLNHWFGKPAPNLDIGHPPIEEIVLSDSKGLAIVPSESLKKGTGRITRIPDNEFIVRDGITIKNKPENLSHLEESISQAEEAVTSTVSHSGSSEGWISRVFSGGSYVHSETPEQIAKAIEGVGKGASKAGKFALVGLSASAALGAIVGGVGKQASHAEKLATQRQISGLGLAEQPAFNPV